MLRDEHGQVTVFLALIFLVLLGFALCILEGIHSFAESSLAEDALKGAGNYVLANYERNIFNNYHVFFLDPRERENITLDGKEYLDQYAGRGSLFSFSCGSLTVTKEAAAVDDDGTYLKHQIREWMKYRTVAKAGKALKQLFNSSSYAKRGTDIAKADMNKAGEAVSIEEAKEQTDSAPDEGRDLEQEGKNGGQAEREKEGMSPQTGAAGEEGIHWKDLKDMLAQITQSGILFYVTDDVSKLSSLSVSGESFPSRKYQQKMEKEDLFGTSFSFLKVDEWKNILENIQTDNMDSHILTDEYFLLSYADECFRSYEKEIEGTSALKYETEYLIAGKLSDRENLKAVANRMLMLRFAVNYACLSQSSRWKAASNSTAGALTGLLGFPQAQKAVQILLTAAVSLGESMLDVHALFSGEEVPVIKTEKTWNLTLKNGGTLLKNKGPVKKGEVNVSYEDYLKLLLSASLIRDKGIYRMMDIMQANTALEEPGFLMEESLFSFQWSGEFYCKSWFSVFPGVSGREQSGFAVTLDRMNSY